MVTIICRRFVSFYRHRNTTINILSVSVVVITSIPPIVLTSIIDLIAWHYDILICCQFTPSWELSYHL